MEYTIYSESLVYYALCDHEGRYYLTDYTFGYNLSKIKFFESLSVAESIRSDKFNDCEIRKVKVIDIGKA